MTSGGARLTFSDAMDWIGRHSGHYAMKVLAHGVVISVRVGASSASVVANSTSENDLQSALLSAIDELHLD